MASSRRITKSESGFTPSREKWQTLRNCNDRIKKFDPAWEDETDPARCLDYLVSNTRDPQPRDVNELEYYRKKPSSSSKTTSFRSQGVKTLPSRGVVERGGMEEVETFTTRGGELRFSGMKGKPKGRAVARVEHARGKPERGKPERGKPERGKPERGKPGRGVFARGGESSSMGTKRINTEELDGESLIDAVFENNYKSVKSIINSGVNIDYVGENGWNALMYASLNGYDPIVNLLIKGDADLDLQDYLGQTALMKAANKDKLSIVKKLINDEADISITDNNGNDVFHYAKGNVKRFLREKPTDFFKEKTTGFFKEKTSRSGGGRLNKGGGQRLGIFAFDRGEVRPRGNIGKGLKRKEKDEEIVPDVNTLIRVNVGKTISKSYSENNIIIPNIYDYIVRRELLDLNDVHEDFVGVMAMNKLRYYIPNFIYTYNTFDVKGYDIFAFEHVNKLSNINSDNFLETYMQVLLALQLALERYGFTHYNLIYDNVILRQLPQVEGRFIHENEYRIAYELQEPKKTHFLRVRSVATIKDYSRSRIKYNGKNYGNYVNISTIESAKNSYPIFDSFMFFISSMNRFWEDGNSIEQFYPIYQYFYGNATPKAFLARVVKNDSKIHFDQNIAKIDHKGLINFIVEKYLDDVSLEPISEGKIMNCRYGAECVVNVDDKIINEIDRLSYISTELCKMKKLGVDDLRYNFNLNKSGFFTSMKSMAFGETKIGRKNLNSYLKTGILHDTMRDSYMDKIFIEEYEETVLNYVRFMTELDKLRG